jgi:hypothetical protein
VGQGGHIRAGGVDRDVTFVDPDDDVDDQLDEAYAGKLVPRSTIS